MLLVRLPQTDMKPYRNTVTNDDLQCPRVCMHLPRSPCNMKIRPFSTVSRQCLSTLCCQPHRTSLSKLPQGSTFQRQTHKTSPLDTARSSTFWCQTHKTRPFAIATNFCCLLRKRRAFDGNHLSTCHRTDFPGGFGSAFARGPHFPFQKKWLFAEVYSWYR